MLRDVIERFRYRYQLWRRERDEDLFGIPRDAVPAVYEDDSEGCLSGDDSSKDDVVGQEPVHHQSNRFQWCIAALLFVFGLFVLLRADSAKVHHTIVRAKHGAVVDPWQSNFAAFLCFALAAYIISKIIYSQRDV